MLNKVQRYELTEMSRNPYESYRCMEEDAQGDFVRFEAYCDLHPCHLAEVDLITDIVSNAFDNLPNAGTTEWDLLKLSLINEITDISEGR